MLMQVEVQVLIRPVDNWIPLARIQPDPRVPSLVRVVSARQPNIQDVDASVDLSG
jgi:hypothetical protein